MGNLGKAFSLLIYSLTFFRGSFKVAAIYLEIPTNSPVLQGTDLFRYELLQRLSSNFYRYVVHNMTENAISDYCPSTKTCSLFSIENSISTNNHQKCCLPCGCGDDCFAKGNCCHDKELSRPNQPNDGTYTKDGRTCVKTVFTRKTEGNWLSSRYLLKSTCLERSNIKGNKVMQTEGVNDTSHESINIKGMSISLDEMIVRCLSPNDLDILDVTPVSNLISGQSYRNIFCAFCNNETDRLEDWDTYLNCDLVEDLPTSIFNEHTNRQDVYRTIRSQKLCIVFWEPPVSNQLTVDRCIGLDTISDCPVYAPEYLTSACKNKHYYIPYMGTNYVYRNIFCFACNVFKHNEQLRGATESCLGSPQLAFLSSFFLILDFRPLEAASTHSLLRRTSQCENGLTYNAEMVGQDFRFVC